jgi:hypothetical protein
MAIDERTKRRCVYRIPDATGDMGMIVLTFTIAPHGQGSHFDVRTLPIGAARS